MYTFENVLAKSTILPIEKASAAAATGVAVDTSGFGDGVVVITVGAATGAPTAQSVAGKLQESADGSTGWTDITGAAITAITTNDKTSEIKVALNSRVAHLRYIRAVVTPTLTGGTTPTIPVSAVVILGNPEYGAVANSAIGD